MGSTLIALHRELFNVGNIEYATQGYLSRLRCEDKKYQ